MTTARDESSGHQPSRPLSYERLTKRAEFLAAAKGRRFHTARLTVQARQRTAEPSLSAETAESLHEAPRFGLTVTKKVGNSVVRNRVKRRLREALRLSAAATGTTGVDYVIVARREVLAAPFELLVADLVEGLRRSSPKPVRPPSPAPAEH